MLSAPTQESVALVKELGIMNGEAMPQPVDEKKESPSADGYIPHEIPIHGQGIPPMMNGMPPSQVYVDTTMGYRGMNVIESQFQVLGISDAHDTNNFEDSEGNDATGEGSNEDDPVKLFIGQVSKYVVPMSDVRIVYYFFIFYEKPASPCSCASYNLLCHYTQVPKTMSEEDIFPTFDPFGPLKDVAIIRDKHTGLHRGCAFVTYWSGADAERAQEALHDKFTFPGARRPAQVKPAEPSGKKHLG